MNPFMVRQAHHERPFTLSLSKGEGIAVVLIFLSLFVRAPELASAKPATLQAGVAKVEITPQVGTPLAGYGKRKGKSSVGIRDPLFVRALALSDGEETVVLVSADLLVFPQSFAEELIQRISSDYNIPRQAIVLATTHTHSGTGAFGHGFLHEKVFGKYDRDILEGIKGRILWAVHQALQNRAPVQWAGAEADLLNGLLENRAVGDGPVDPGLSTLLLENPDNSVRAVVVNLAAHPTLMDSRDMRFSADFPGELCRRIETVYPGSTCFFLNGAAGDTRPADRIGRDPDQRIERLGSALEESVTSLINQSRFRSQVDLDVSGGWFQLPPPQIRLGLIPIHPWIGAMFRPTSIFLGLIELDEFLLVPLPAELTSELGQELKTELRAMGFRPLVIGYANGYLGYAVTPQRYRTGSYESWMTWYGPEFGSFLKDRLRSLTAFHIERRKK